MESKSQVRGDDRCTRRIRSRVNVLLGAALVLGWPTAVGAQSSRLGIDVRGGVSVGQGSFADGSSPGQGAEPGPAFSVALLVPRSPRLAWSLGFAQHRFGCAEAGCPPDDPYVVTGFEAGVRVSVPTGPAVTPWVSVAAAGSRVEAHGLPGPEAGVSTLGLGASAAVGVQLLADRAVSVGPALTWWGFDSELPSGARMRVRHVSALLAVVVSF